MDLQTLKENVAAGLESARGASSDEAIEAVRITYLGRKGLMPQVMRELKSVAPEDRAEVGSLANSFKNELAQLLERRRGELSG